MRQRLILQRLAAAEAAIDGFGPPGGITDHSELTGIGTKTHGDIDEHIASEANPHKVSKAQVDLGNCDNTSDANKPISNAMQSGLDGKAALSHTHALADLTQGGASLGQVIKWNGTAWAPGADATGAGGSANVGTATLDFGAFPGRSDASVVVTGQAGIVAGSVVQARLRPAATADHSADEHLVETLRIEAGNIEAGSGFTIYGINSSQLNGQIIAPGTILWQAEVGDGEHPLVLAQNEGFSIRSVAVPATGTWTAAISVDWAEVTGY